MPDSVREKFLVIVSGVVMLALVLYEGVVPASEEASGDRPVIEGPGPGLVATTRAEISLPDAEAVTLRIVGRTDAVAVDGDEPVGLGVPAGSYLVAAEDGERLAGLSLHLETSDPVIEAIRVDGRSTARALVAMLPGILAADADLVRARLAAAETSQAFVELRARLDSEPVDLRDPPVEITTLVTTVADEVITSRQTISVRRPPCEGDRLDVPAAPICVGTDEQGDLLVRNGTQGWIVVSRGNSDQPCALIAPGTPVLAGSSDANQIEVTYAGELVGVSLADCGAVFGLVTTGRRDSTSTSERFANGLSILSEHAITIGTLVGVELADPRDDASAATELLVPFLARGGPIDQASLTPTAAAYAESSLALVGDPSDAAAAAVVAHIRRVAGQMVSVPVELSTVGLVITDISP